MHDFADFGEATSLAVVGGSFSGFPGLDFGRSGGRRRGAISYVVRRRKKLEPGKRVEVGGEWVRGAREVGEVVEVFEESEVGFGVGVDER